MDGSNYDHSTLEALDHPHRARAAEIVHHAREVIAQLEHYGPGMVPHLLDTDDNAGQRLRGALDGWRDNTTEATDQVRPVVDSVARIEDLRRATMRAMVAEVRRLRDQVAELEQLRSADIAVIGKLGAAVATQRPLAELQARYLEARQHTLSTAGLPYADAVIDQAAYVADEAHELQSAAEDLANDGAVGDATGRTLTTDELLTATRHEIADVALSLVTLANIIGVTVEACIAEKTEADRGRG